MTAMMVDTIYELLGTCHIAGSKEQQQAFLLRISELVALNGEQWVRRHAERLLSEWQMALALQSNGDDSGHPSS